MNPTNVHDYSFSLVCPTFNHHRSEDPFRIYSHSDSSKIGVSCQIVELVCVKRTVDDIGFELIMFFVTYRTYNQLRYAVQIQLSFIIDFQYIIEEILETLCLKDFVSNHLMRFTNAESIILFN